MPDGRSRSSGQDDPIGPSRSTESDLRYRITPPEPRNARACRTEGCAARHPERIANAVHDTRPPAGSRDRQTHLATREPPTILHANGDPPPPGLCGNQPTPRPEAHLRSSVLPGSVMVARVTLDHLVQVRILTGQLS